MRSMHVQNAVYPLGDGYISAKSWTVSERLNVRIAVVPEYAAAALKDDPTTPDGPRGVVWTICTRCISSLNYREPPLDQCDEAARPITFRDLLPHCSGLTYGDFHGGPIGRAYAIALGLLRRKA